MPPKSLQIVTSAPVSAAWAEADELQDDVRVVCESPVVGALLESVDCALLVLNAKRQIVAANTRSLGPSARTVPVETLIGMRPGEALQCRFGSNHAAGCGTGDACRECGAFAAIAASQTTGHSAEHECVLTVGNDDAPLELRVRATPITLQSRQYTVVSLRDISNEKRRESLEQVFFHDLMNTVSALSAWSWALNRESAQGSGKASERVSQLIEHLGREVGYQRALLEAERGTLRPNRVRVDATQVLGKIKAICSGLGEARRCTLAVEPPPAIVEFETDVMLLQRVLINMVKNAFEASSPGATVRLYCEIMPCADLRMSAPANGPAPRAHSTTAGGSSAGSVLAFRVHNEASIPEHVAQRVFQRSYTTKIGKGRGLGTYSMKLLGERYLGGRVSFTSTPSEGTTFSIEIPIASPPKQDCAEA